VLALIIHPDHVVIFAVNVRAAEIDVMGLIMGAAGVENIPVYVSIASARQSVVLPFTGLHNTTDVGVQ
jgi:hypothetical protein